MQSGVGFLIDDGAENDDDMDLTQPFGGTILSPSRDGVGRFLSGDYDQTMEFTQIYSSNAAPASPRKEEDTVEMEFTKVVGKVQSVNNDPLDKENRPPTSEDDTDGISFPTVA